MLLHETGHGASFIARTRGLPAEAFLEEDLKVGLKPYVKVKPPRNAVVCQHADAQFCRSPLPAWRSALAFGKASATKTTEIHGGNSVIRATSDVAGSNGRSSLHDETPTARTITLDVPDWPGHIAGQHVDVRVTAPDGYSAVRSYSIASAPNSHKRVEMTVERLPNGEVSPYLTQEAAAWLLFSVLTQTWLNH
jgi:hypothetical protein